MWEHLRQSRDIHREHFVHHVQKLCVELGKLCEIVLHQLLLHDSAGGEIPDRDLLALVEHVEDLVQVVDEAVFLRLLPEQRGHFAPQVIQDEGLDFGQSGSFDELVQLPDCVGAGQSLDVDKQVFLLVLKQCLILKMLTRLVPERADVHAYDLRCTQHLAQRPHQGSVHTHKLLCGDHV